MCEWQIRIEIKIQSCRQHVCVQYLIMKMYVSKYLSWAPALLSKMKLPMLTARRHREYEELPIRKEDCKNTCHRHLSRGIYDVRALGGFFMYMTPCLTSEERESGELQKHGA